jgi:release factor glutamine methyltransferase
MASLADRLASPSEAKWIVAHAIHIAPGTILSALDDPVSSTAVEAVRAMGERRMTGEPLQYVLGEWSFRRIDLRVDRRALVPRPETEQVVEVALGELGQPARGGDGSVPTPRVAADLGTGTGVIALSLAVEGPADLEIWGTDVSGDALQLAQANLSALTTSRPDLETRVRLRQGPWFEALPPDLAGRLGLVVSNPPYVSAAEWSGLDAEVRDHEPRLALVPGPTGLEALDALVDGAGQWLAPGGSLVLELAPHQAVTMAGRAESAGYVGVRVVADLAGRDRTLVARRPR